MDEPTHRVRSDQPQRPHDQKNHKNSPKHVSTPLYKELTLSGFLSAQRLSSFFLANHLFRFLVNSTALVSRLLTNCKLSANYFMIATI
jgi:hypothetical protein